MKTSTKRTSAGLLLTTAAIALTAAGAVGWAHRSAAATPAAPDSAGPVAAIRSELPTVHTVAEIRSALGDVTVGQTSGLGFARAGQLTTLAVVAGDTVRQGQLLATLVPDPAVREAYQQAVDAVSMAQRERDRQIRLLAAHLSTQSQADAAEKSLLDARSAVQALEAQGGGSAASQLRAPFDGVVTTVSALQGDRIAAGAPVLQIGRDDVLRVLIGIDPADRARVRAGMPVTLRAVTGPGVVSPEFELRLSQVQDTLDPKTQLIDAVALLPRGAAPWLVAGMKVQARLQLGAMSAVAVPRNAVLSDERGDYVFQVVAGKAHRVAVKRQLDDGTRVAIAGLSDLAQPVVVEGNYELQDGMAVKDAAR